MQHSGVTALFWTLFMRWIFFPVNNTDLDLSPWQVNIAVWSSGDCLKEEMTLCPCSLFGQKWLAVIKFSHHLKYSIWELLSEQVPHWPLLTTLKNNLAPILCNHVSFVFQERCVLVLVLFTQEQTVSSKSCRRQRKRNIKHGDCYGDFTKGWKKWWQKFLPSSLSGSKFEGKSLASALTLLSCEIGMLLTELTGLTITLKVEERRLAF